MTRENSRMSELKSRIYYTETAGTQTDHAGLYQQIEPSITMPISHYNKLASGYYHNAYKSTHSHGSTTGHSMKIADGSCQTDPPVNCVSVEVMTDDVIISTVPTKSNVVEAPQKNTIKLNLKNHMQPVKSARVETTSSSPITPSLPDNSQSSTIKKSIDQLPKIPFKTYVEREKQKKSEQIAQPVSTTKTSPIVTAPLADRVINGSSKTQNNSPDTQTSHSLKRKSTPEQEKEKSTKKINNPSTEMVQDLMSALTKIMETESKIESFQNENDLKAWILKKFMDDASKEK